MTRTLRPVALVMLFLAVIHRRGEAQLGCAGATCTVEISMPVTDVLRLTLSTSGVGLGTPLEADYLAGYRDVAGAAASVSVKSNRAYRVQVAGLAPAFSYLGALADPAKPASDLLWSASAAGLATTTINMGSPGTLMNFGAGTATSPLFLRTRWDLARDVPGIYSLAIRFTVSAP